jgi:hypothetical protein
MLASVIALYNWAGLPQGPLLCGRRMQEVLRKKLAVLLAAVMMLVMAASPAWTAPGKGQGGGLGIGGGDAQHADNGQHTATGGGVSNNPHVGGGCEIC